MFKLVFSRIVGNSTIVVMQCRAEICNKKCVAYAELLFLFKSWFSSEPQVNEPGRKIKFQIKFPYIIT